MRTARLGGAVALVLALALGACSGGGGSSSSDPGVEVVAGFAPLAEVARRIGGPDVHVVDLTPAGTEPHDLELTTDQVDAIEDADLVLLAGGGFQPAVEKAAARADTTVLDVLDGVRGDDPHVWLDPVVMAELVDRVRDRLVAADAAHRATFEERAAGFRAEVEELDGEFRDGLGDCDRRTIVTTHAAFGRLAGRYDLRQVALSGIAPDAEVDPKRLDEVARLMRAEGVTTVFTEALVSPRVAEALAREAGVGTAVLDPIESATEGSDYTGQMRANLAALRTALGCR